MPSTSVHGRLYWSDHTKTWHYEFRFRRVKYNGDTGIGTSRPFAERWLNRYRERLAADEVDLPDDGADSTLREILAAWATYERGSLSGKHIQDRVDVVQLHFRSVLNLPVNLLTTERLDKIRSTFVNGTWRGKGWRKNTPSRPRTKGGWNRVRTHLLALLRWGIERKMLRRIPFTSARLKPQKEVAPVVWPEQVIQYLAEIERLTPYAKDVRTAVRLMLQLGLREAETLQARWEWFNARLKVCWPQRTKNREVREIALPPGLLPYLRRIHGKHTRGLIIPGESNQPHSGQYTRDVIKAAGEAIGIPGLTPHRMRATFATTHYEAGTPITQIQQMMGHKVPETTMKYIVQRPKDQAQAQATVARLMGLTSSPPPVPGRSKKTKKMHVNTGIKKIKSTAS